MDLLPGGAIGIFSLSRRIAGISVGATKQLLSKYLDITHKGRAKTNWKMIQGA